MIYVLSDVHGRYGKYSAMLGKIGLRKTDRLYVLGVASGTLGCVCLDTMEEYYV